MEKASKRFRLHGDSVFELTAAWEKAVVGYQDRIRFHDRKLQPGPALNGVVAAFLTLPREEQLSFLAKGMRRYESLTLGAGASVEEKRTPKTKRPK